MEVKVVNEVHCDSLLDRGERNSYCKVENSIDTEARAMPQ